MIKYILFGGAFDPIHMSHLQKVQQVLDIAKYDKALFMPAYRHQWGKKMADVEHRINMVSHAIEDFEDDRMCLSTFEIDHKLSGSTFEMIQRLFQSEEFTPKNVAYLIGMDHANLMNKWDNWQRLINAVPFIVMNRVGVSIKQDWFFRWPHRLIDSAGALMSSTEIRSKLKTGGKISELTPNTLKYIQEHGLYV